MAVRARHFDTGIWAIPVPALLGTLGLSLTVGLLFWSQLLDQTRDFRVLEASILGVTGALLAVSALQLVNGLIHLREGPTRIILAFGLAVGSLNGLFAGFAQIYDWSNASGYLAFVLDSTVGIVGTALGICLHIYNQLQSGSGFALELSHRENLFIYDRGFGIGRLAFTLGNTVSNLDGREWLIGHEATHVWQSRVFGPFFQIVYSSWCALGSLFGVVAATIGQGSAIGNVIEYGYEANPWEMWADR